MAAVDEPDLQHMLDAIIDVAGELHLRALLSRIVQSACEIAGARYGALGVLAEDGTLAEFIPHGVSEALRARIGGLPKGHGILGLLTTDPRPLRLTDLTAHSHSCGFPAHHPPMRSFLGVPIRVRGKVYGNLYLTEKASGAEFTARDEEMVAALAAGAGMAIANATLFDQTQRREFWLRASHDITTSLLEGTAPATALRLIAERARQVADAPVAAVALPDEANSANLVFDVVDGVGMGAEKLTGLSVPIAETGSGRVFATGKASILQHYGAHVVSRSDDPTVRFPPRIAELDSAVAVPLAVGGEILGVLVVARFRGDVAFSGAELQMAQMFAGQAALALEFGRAEEDRRRLAVFEDRDRIARDLHDLVIQRLFAIGLGLQGMSRLIVRKEVVDRVAGFVQDVDQTIRDVRRSIFSLQEAREGYAGLRAELLRAVQESTVALGFEPRIDFDGPLDSLVPDTVREDLLATLREALSNVSRHAVAEEVSVEVRVQRDGRALSLTVTDDGIGLPESPHRRSGLGNLDRRAKRWGGTLRLRRPAVGGTCLRWHVPLVPVGTTSSDEELE
ncbi:MAG: GAF domain-containing protein [Sciscionella sp.]